MGKHRFYQQGGLSAGSVRMIAENSAQTGRVGLNYLFDVGLSPYVSYATSFTPNLGADQRRQVVQAHDG